jgi:hypothetical protein
MRRRRAAKYTPPISGWLSLQKGGPPTLLNAHMGGSRLPLCDQLDTNAEPGTSHARSH